MTSTAAPMPTLCGHKLLSPSTDYSPAVLECAHCRHTWGILRYQEYENARISCPKCWKSPPRELTGRIPKTPTGAPTPCYQWPQTERAMKAARLMVEGLHPSVAAEKAGITQQYGEKIFYRYVLPARLRAEIDRLTAELRQRAG